MLYQDRFLNDFSSPLGICIRFRDYIRQQLLATAEWLSIQMEQILGRMWREAFPHSDCKEDSWATGSQKESFKQ